MFQVHFTGLQDFPQDSKSDLKHTRALVFLVVFILLYIKSGIIIVSGTR